MAMAIKKSKVINIKIKRTLASVRKLERKATTLRDATYELLQKTNELLETYDNTRMYPRG